MQNPALNPAILLAPAQDSYVAYDPTTDRLHTLNPLAALITELCDGSRSVDQIRQIVAPLLPAEQSAEIDRCIQQGVEAGLFISNGTSGAAHRELTAKELFDLAHRLEKGGKLQTALICAHRVTELAPDNPNGWYYLAELAELLGRRDETIAAYEKYSELKPENEEVRHILIALHGEPPPARMPDKCVRQIYDDFASSFESRLVEDLGYKGPQRVRELIAPLLVARPDQAQPTAESTVIPNWRSDQDRHPERAERGARNLSAPSPEPLALGPPASRENDAVIPNPAASCSPQASTTIADVGEGSAFSSSQPRPTLQILDLGCGTGLGALQFKPYAARLVGVDISAEMLALAQKRGLYDRLDVAEITAWLDANTDRFDLALCCDCLIYFGDLQPVASGVSRLLTPGGIFAFTLERGQLFPYKLNDAGRYEHHADYVREVAARAGLEVARMEEGFLRTEYAKEVTGLFAALIKPAVRSGSPS